MRTPEGRDNKVAEAVGSTITVRLDSGTDDRLEALVEHFNEIDPLQQGVSTSQVVRSSIDSMYEKHLTLSD